jgi:quercetin dioxygenase-like cupin family protein
VVLDPEASEYVRVLGGPPTTVTMRSGYVVLAPGKSMDKHSTEGYEEAVVVLEGKGVMVATQGDSLSLVKWSVAYCPPQTEHSVTNTGTEPLRYVYVVASAGTSK